MPIGTLELKKRIDAVPIDGGGNRRYPKELRLLVLEHVARRMAEGTSQSAAARELGIHLATLGFWRQSTSRAKPARGRKAKHAGPRSAPRVRPVTVAEEPPSAPVVVLPGGARIEGLSVAQLTELVKALS